MRPLARSLVAFFLIAPFAFVVVKVETWTAPAAGLLMKSWLHTALQSALSATGSLVLGFIGATGILRWGRFRTLVEAAVLLPAFVPVLFVLVAVLTVVKPFPYGLGGVVLVHVLMTAGLLSVSLARIIQEKLGGLSEVSLLMGVPRGLFFRSVVIPQLKLDLMNLWLFVFTLCFASFSVPLVVGGGGARVMEVLIFERIMVHHDFGQAIVLSAVQLLTLFFLSGWVRGQSSPGWLRPANMELLSVKGMEWPLLVLTTVAVGVNLQGLVTGLQQLQSVGLTPENLWHPLLGTVVVSLGTGLVTVGVLALCALGAPHRRFDRLLKSYLAPSAALTGFGFLLVGAVGLAAQTPMVASAKMCVGLTLLFFGSLYRMRFSGQLATLARQIEVAESLGANPLLVFRNVIWPQVAPTAYFLAGVSAFWACGEFAFSQILTGEDITLSLVTASLLGSYRLEAATALVWLLLIVGSGVFSLFWSMSYVSNKKLVS